MNNSEFRSLLTSAECQYTHGVLDKNEPPPLTDTARRWVKKMEADHKKGKDVGGNILEFFDYFGTHIVTEIILGAKYTYNFTMKTGDWDKMEQDGKSHNYWILDVWHCLAPIT